MHSETLTTQDGTKIAARLYSPQRKAVGAVLIVAAMGVPQHYYEAFSEWLCAQGFWVLTFDFRGCGLSRRGALRDEQADVLTWAKEDTAAALQALLMRAGDVPITWIGHSLGGQIAPLVPGVERVEKIITVSSGTGYWRENAPVLRRKVWILWFFAAPLFTPLFGYFPGRRLGMVGDLPRGVMKQWRKWCLNPEYCVGAEGAWVREAFASVKAPLVSIAFSDDEMMSERNIAQLYGFYTHAQGRLRRIAPKDVGLARIGHFGFFRREMREALWEPILRPELAVSRAAVLQAAP